MYKENYLKSLRKELIELVENYLTPVAMKFGYNDVPLETGIKWKPLVLLLGNYSSGKSTLINEFIGTEVQKTGQAPTDDSFTIITIDDSVDLDSDVRVTEERDGKVLLNDPEYPFESMKKHGQKFASHFKLKKVNSSFLKNIALIDTPGMLDSITERDRGYNYQDVIGDLAQMADLVLVFFDPHKAGTVREAHISLRETLPSRTFEDRVHFVLNRIDECSSMTDLMRVYGTLCWNLSQITGRKDIPMIHLTYSQSAVEVANNNEKYDLEYLKYLENQREELKNTVLETPHYHIDKLASFVEVHSERLSHLLEALASYSGKFSKFRFKYYLSGFLIGSISGFSLFFYLLNQQHNQDVSIGSGSLFLGIFMILWYLFPKSILYSKFHNNIFEKIDDLTLTDTQTRKDSWEFVKDLTKEIILKNSGKLPYGKLRKEYNIVHNVFTHGSKDIREGINELSSLNNDTEIK